MGSVTNLKENKTIFIPCSCNSEILVIEYDQMSLWQRIRYCYQILVYKKPYADQMVLDKNQLKDLQKFLNGLSL